MIVRHREENADPGKHGTSSNNVVQLPVATTDLALLELLIPVTVPQMLALEAADNQGGLTVGQMVRYLIREFLSHKSIRCFAPTAGTKSPNPLTSS